MSRKPTSFPAGLPAAAAIWLATAGPGKACALALVLALDVSASISPREYDLQREGLAWALEQDDVTRAINAQGGIWLTVFEWSGAHHQYDWFDWRFLDGPESSAIAAAQIRATERRVSEFPTALGYALIHARLRLREAPEPCTRQVIDVAGDGVNNDGFPPASGYRASDMTGITVNALVITDDGQQPAPYFQRHVIRGPGAFVEIAESYENYARAMRRKLLREIGAAYVQLR